MQKIKLFGDVEVSHHNHVRYYITSLVKLSKTKHSNYMVTCIGMIWNFACGMLDKHNKNILFNDGIDDL